MTTTLGPRIFSHNAYRILGGRALENWWYTAAEGGSSYTTQLAPALIRWAEGPAGEISAP